MYLRRLLLVRFDYVLPENADELYQNLEDKADSQPNNLPKPTLRDNIRRDQTFQFDGGKLSPDFDSVEVRAVESNAAFVEVISVAEVSRSTLIELAFESDAGDRRIRPQSTGINDLKREIENVRLWIPGDEQGPETTIFWADVYPRPSSLRGTSISTIELEMEFQDGIEHRFLRDFNVSSGRGILTLSGEQVMFLGTPKKMFGHALAINLDGSLRRNRQLASMPGSLSFLVPDEFVALSALYGTHFWCKARGKQIDDFEDAIQDAKETLPATNSLDPQEYLDLDSTVYDLQEDWTTLHGRIPSEQDELITRVRGFNIEHEDTGKNHSRFGDSNDGILRSYVSSLENEVERIQFDEQRVDDVFNSLSEYTSNQLSAVASQERQRASQENRRLQRKVYQFTILVAVLTVVLTVDAMMSGGLSAFIDNVFSEGIPGISNQIWKTLGAFVLAGIIFVKITLDRGRGWWKPSGLD